MLNEGYQIHDFFGTASVRTFVIPFYYGSGSSRQKATVPTDPQKC
jgi:hypothetical protein